MSYSLYGDNPILACPKCHSRQYIFEALGKCICKNHKIWFKAEIDQFIREGEKWDNKETSNAI